MHRFLLSLVLPLLVITSCSGPKEPEAKPVRQVTCTPAMALYLNQTDSVVYIHPENTQMLLIHRDSSSSQVALPAGSQVLPVHIPAYICQLSHVQEISFMMPVNRIPKELSCLRMLRTAAIRLYGNEDLEGLAASINEFSQLQILRVSSLSDPGGTRLAKLKGLLRKDLLVVEN